MISLKLQAILNLVPNAEINILDDKIEWINPSTSPVTEDQIQNEFNRLQQEYNKNEYQRMRDKEYPSFAEQFDLLYHGGYDAWKQVIQQVKDKYPKG